MGPSQAASESHPMCESVQTQLQAKGALAQSGRMGWDPARRLSLIAGTSQKSAVHSSSMPLTIMCYADDL